MTKETKAVENTQQYLLFEVAGNEFAVELTSIVEIQSVKSVTPLPEVPPYIVGLTNLRGRIVILVNLGLRLGISPTTNSAQIEGAHMMICKLGETFFGVLVDEVGAVIAAPVSALMSVPPVSKFEASLIKNSLLLDSPERAVLVLDLPKVLTELELAKYNERAESV